MKNGGRLRFRKSCARCLTVFESSQFRRDCRYLRIEIRVEVKKSKLCCWAVVEVKEHGIQYSFVITLARLGWQGFIGERARDQGHVI